MHKYLSKKHREKSQECCREHIIKHVKKLYLTQSHPQLQPSLVSNNPAPRQRDTSLQKLSSTTILFCFTCISFAPASPFLSALCIRVLTCQLYSLITITGIDITMTSLLPAEVSKTTWIRVPPTLPSCRWVTEVQKHNVSQAGTEGGRQGRRGS